MRGWRELGYEKPGKKSKHLDVIEVVGELVDLTTIIDSSDEEDELSKKKREKKWKKEQKRQKEEKRRADMKKASLAKAKTVREAKIRKEAEWEARGRADEAARRYAERLDSYDKSSMPANTGIDDASLASLVATLPAAAVPAFTPPSKRMSVAPSKAETPPATKPRVASAPGPVWDDGQPSPSAQKDASKTAMESDEVVSANRHDVPVPRPDKVGPLPEDAFSARPEKKGAAPNTDNQGTSMAAAIAAAQKEESFAKFASFDAFDANASHGKAHGIDDPEFEADEEDDVDGLLPVEFFSLNDLPEELSAPTDMTSEPGLYVAHFIRYMLGAWQQVLGEGTALVGKELTAQTIAMYGSKEKLRFTMDALKPLLRQLRNRSLSDDVLKQLELVVRLAAGREYDRCSEEYVVITMGRKTWHNSVTCFQQQQNHGGSIRKIIKQSELVDFDCDPVMQAYMHALKRLIQLAQLIRPPAVPAKSVFDR